MFDAGYTIIIYQRLDLTIQPFSPVVARFQSVKAKTQQWDKGHNINGQRQRFCPWYACSRGFKEHQFVTGTKFKHAAM